MDSSPQHIHRTFAHRTSTTHKYIGYTIGIMSLLVTAVVIYGVGGPLFPKKYYRHLSQEQRDKGFYENIAPHIPSKHALTVIQLSFPSLFVRQSKIVFRILFCHHVWLVGCSLFGKNRRYHFETRTIQFNKFCLLLPSYLGLDNRFGDNIHIVANWFGWCGRMHLFVL